MTRQYAPTPEERDERFVVELPADEFLRKVLRAGPHPAQDPKRLNPKPRFNAPDADTSVMDDDDQMTEAEARDDWARGEAAYDMAKDDGAIFVPDATGEFLIPVYPDEVAPL